MILVDLSSKTNNVDVMTIKLDVSTVKFQFSESFGGFQTLKNLCTLRHLKRPDFVEPS